VFSVMSGASILEFDASIGAAVAPLRSAKKRSVYLNRIIANNLQTINPGNTFHTDRVGLTEKYYLTL